MPLIKQLERYFEQRKEEWHFKAALTRMVWKDHRGIAYSPENVGRRLRDLEAERVICVSYEGINAKYRYIPQTWRKRYVPIDKRRAYSDAQWAPAI